MADRVKHPDEMTPEEYDAWMAAATSRLNALAERGAAGYRDRRTPWERERDDRLEELAEERKLRRMGEDATDADADQAADEYYDRMEREW